MKILVTVGTSSFDRLIKAVDKEILDDQYQVTCQISDGTYKPKNHDFFHFSDQFPELLEQADIVITHGGAGTIFQLLDMKKKIIVVPNLDRVDKHQTDLATFVCNEGYAIVCNDLGQLQQKLKQCLIFKPNTYHKEEFFMADELMHYFSLK
ncbi:MAG: PssE/Cps14G family polysaccharide biosynthesis glycosyltransferase [Cognaticolwellia sp.]